MLDYKNIITKRYALNLSFAQLAEEFNASKSGVNDFIRRFEACDKLSYPLPEGITNYAIHELVYDDNKIIQLYFDRDENAIKATSEKYGNYCSSIAINILGNKEDAEECVNDTYFKTWNSIPPNRPSVLRTYLGKITRNVAFDFYKKKNTEKRGKGHLAVILDELGDCVSGGYEPEKEYSRKECIDAINSFLETLSDEKCAFFVRRYWYAETITVIAKRYGNSANYVSVSLSRVRKRLHDYLIERGFEL